MRSEIFNIDTAILTSRTLIRRVREGDGAAFYDLVNDNTSYIEDHFPRLIETIRDTNTAETFARQRLAKWLLQEEFTFTIWRNTEADLIGFVHFRNLDWSTPSAEIAYFLDQHHAGRGIMTEVLTRMIQFAFRQLQLNRLALRTLVDNYASQRLARKVGFRREGDLRHAVRRVTGTLHDIMLFGLTREEYGA
ncbi:MAG: GNAT family protein [Bacteroidota bacterium]